MSSFLGRALGAGLLTRGMDCLDVVLIRHGQQVRPGHDAPEAASYDPPLSETGRAQAAATAEVLAGLPLIAAYSSQLARAHATGQAVAEPHGLDVTIDERLAEVGIFRDVPADASFEQTVGAQAAAEAHARMVRTLTWDAVPLGEGSAEFRTRVHAAIWEIARTHLPAATAGKGTDASGADRTDTSGTDGTDTSGTDGKGTDTSGTGTAARAGVPRRAAQPPAVAVACHGGVVNAFLAEEYGLDRDFLFRPAHAGITRVRFSAERAVMLTGNESAHLEAAGLLTF